MLPCLRQWFTSLIADDRSLLLLFSLLEGAVQRGLRPERGSANNKHDFLNGYC